jgi:hypothetical protein
MSILGFLKRIKAPSFQDEFIQDPAERLIEGGKAGKTGRLPASFDEEEAEEFSKRLREDWERNPSNPGSSSNMPLLIDE